jgi:RNA polymerase sigma factor (sigma-70 family)
VDSDSDLLRRYAEEGSEEAFGELVRRRIALVYGSALRQLGDVHRAKEIVQVVFSDLARKAPSLCRRPVLASWLYTSTHYAVSNLIRKQRRQQSREHEAFLMHDIDSQGGHDSDWDQLRPLLDRELHGLDGREREAVLLRYFQGMSFAEIGETLGLSQEAARKRVERALERLRLRLGGRGITSSAAALSAILTEQAGLAAPSELAGVVAQAALSQAVGAATTQAGLISFMSTSKTAAVSAALLMLISLGSAVYEGRQAHAAQAELASFQGQAALRAQELGQLEARVTEAERAVAALKKRPPQTRGGAGSSGGALGSSSQAQLSKAKGDAFMALHPEVRDALLAYLDAGHHAQYAALYSALGLSPDQMRQMDVILRLQGGNFGMVLQAGMTTFSAEPGDSGNIRELSAELNTLLGDSGYQQFQAYSQTIPARTVASNLASLLVSTDSALTAGQAQQLVPILANAGDKMTGQFDWSSVFANAQAVLSAPQMDMLRNLGTDAQGWHQVVTASR